MAAELKDFRGKITPEAWCFIEAQAQATGREHSEIVRDVLHTWASKQLDTAKVAARLLRREGIAWNDGESE